ncbi:S-adenosylmethionine decarboxylase proenzyme 4 [Ananas comosus]|uniref:S-adenosylmethionine decarboxylase proenzyme n=1 Tax=Ananas comosus TaxID=4615 RepID=A0A6P5EBZ2_ANACO|nr:S-adenosylmethionine decarboxylase proenzyme 4 [Ananas comosus]
MAVSGFEGFEKRLELRFSGDDPLGLRRLRPDALEEVLDAVQCSVVSAAGNRAFDSYILSESSLFIYPSMIIIKTCGTTQLLRAVPALLIHADSLGLRLRSSRYSRGSFIFPHAQPSPHTSFCDEVLFLQDALPASLSLQKACVLPSGSSSHSWHVYSAASTAEADGNLQPSNGPFTIEVCMTELHRDLARRFYRKEGDDRSGDAVGAEMTATSGITGINPRALICGYAFEPCGYSMNGLDGARYSTIHVTPEDGHSYASFECVGGPEAIESLRKAVLIFQPGVVSVSVCSPACWEDDNDESDRDQICSAVAEVLEPLGLSCRCRAADQFSGVGTVTYQVFRAAHPH